MLQKNGKTEILTFADWGLISYVQSYERQKEIFEATLQQKTKHGIVTNQIIFCEHPHVITIGRHGQLSNLLFPENILKQKQVDLFQTDRGGDVTYHGPGQVVCYLILDLEMFHLGLKAYIYRLEEVIIRTMVDYNLTGGRLNGATGVWLDAYSPLLARKIAAIGVRSSRFVTMHGFALNINTDLNYFQLINPCGFTDKGVTSLQLELGRRIEMEEIKTRLIYQFEQIFCD